MHNGKNDVHLLIKETMPDKDDKTDGSYKHKDTEQFSVVSFIRTIIHPLFCDVLKWDFTVTVST